MGQLKNANISQKTYRDIVDMHYTHILKAYSISNLLMGHLKILSEVEMVSHRVT